MRPRAPLAAGLAAIALIGAAVAPVWVMNRGPEPQQAAATVVPFELSGLYVSACGSGREGSSAATECAGPYALGRLTASPSFDGFHRAMYYGYLAAELVPC